MPQRPGSTREFSSAESQSVRLRTSFRGSKSYARLARVLLHPYCRLPVHPLVIAHRTAASAYALAAGLFDTIPNADYLLHEWLNGQESTHMLEPLVGKDASAFPPNPALPAELHFDALRASFGMSCSHLFSVRVFHLA